MFFYVARQPIFTRNQTLFAYELLFRDGQKNSFPDVSADQATSRLMDGGGFSSAIEELTDGKFAFINFTDKDIVRQLPTLLPQTSLVVEVLETAEPTTALLDSIKQLKEKGYSIALDDFEYADRWLPFMPWVDIIKVDIKLTSVDEARELKQRISRYKIKLLAEKIENYTEYQDYLDLGFQLFQGYFFARPEVIQKRALTPNQMAVTQLLVETTKSDMDINNVCQIVEHDVGMSYRILRFVNSAKFHRSRKIENLKQAIVFLGRQELQKLVAVIATAQLHNEKPNELMKLSITRARFCEHIAVLHGQKSNSAKAFLTGLLSLIDGIMDNDLRHLLEHIPLSDDIRHALLNAEGLLADYLKLVKAYEMAHWQRVEGLTSQLKLSKIDLPDLYMDALNWANAFSETEGHQ